jgi:glycosyltransferase 2 family protein
VIKHAITGLKIAVSLFLIALLLLKLQASDWQSIVRAIDWRVYVGLFVGSMVAQILSTWRWRILCEPLGLADDGIKMFNDYMAGCFYNLFLPTSVGGDIGRAYRIAKRKGQHYLPAVLSTIAERLTGFTVIIAVGLSGLILYRPLHWEVLTLMSLGILVVALTGLYGFVLLERLPIIGPFLQRKIIRIQEHSPAHVIETEHLSYRIWPNHRAVTLALLLSLGIQALNLGLQVVLLHMLGLGDLSIWLVASVYSISSIVSMIPISLSGIGLREGSAVAMLITWGSVPDALASTFSLAWLGLILLGSFPGALITLLESLNISKPEALKQ